MLVAYRLPGARASALRPFFNNRENTRSVTPIETLFWQNGGAGQAPDLASAVPPFIKGAVLGVA